MRTGQSKKPRSRRKNVGRRVARDIIEGLEEILADISGTKPFDGRRYVVDVVDVKALRRALHMSQAQFAATYGFNLRTLQEWEQGRSAPDRSQRAYLRVISGMPLKVSALLAAE
jgi:putative transcriptional regulator